MFTHWGPADHSRDVLTKRMCDPRRGAEVVWGLCESHPVCVGQNHVQIVKAKKKGRIHVSFT